MSLLPGLIRLQAQPEAPSVGSLLIPGIAIFMIFYLLVFRPQQKKQKELEAKIKSIEKGDNVVTAGGLHGKVTGVTDQVLTLDIGGVKGERLKVKVARGRIDSVESANKKDEVS
jgi:preprotein translocase subunit YajC